MLKSLKSYTMEEYRPSYEPSPSSQIISLNACPCDRFFCSDDCGPVVSYRALIKLSHHYKCDHSPLVTFSFSPPIIIIILIIARLGRMGDASSSSQTWTDGPTATKDIAFGVRHGLIVIDAFFFVVVVFPAVITPFVTVIFLHIVVFHYCGGCLLFRRGKQRKGKEPKCKIGGCQRRKDRPAAVFLFLLLVFAIFLIINFIIVIIIGPAIAAVVPETSTVKVSTALSDAIRGRELEDEPNHALRSFLIITI